MIEQVESDGTGWFEQKNKFSVGDEVEVMKPSGENVQTEVAAMFDEEGTAVDSCPHPGQRIRIDLACELAPFDIIRRMGDGSI